MRTWLEILRVSLVGVFVVTIAATSIFISLHVLNILWEPANEVLGGCLIVSALIGLWLNYDNHRTINKLKKDGHSPGDRITRLEGGEPVEYIITKKWKLKTPKS